MGHFAVISTMKYDELKKKSKIKVIFQGPSGSGKTLASSKVALEVMKEGGEVLYIDTEAEGSETIVNLIEDGEYSEDIVERLEYIRPDDYDEVTEVLERASGYDLMVFDTLDHKHTYVLKAVTDAKRDAGADWNEYAQIYSEEKELMNTLGDPDTNIVATLDPESGKSDKPKGAQTNILGYFSAVVELRKKGSGEWSHKVLNWVGKSHVIGNAIPDMPEAIASEINERYEK